MKGRIKLESVRWPGVGKEIKQKSNIKSTLTAFNSDVGNDNNIIIIIIIIIIIREVLTP
jgi:hypothetical protein